MIDRDIDWSLRDKWSYIPERLRGLGLNDWPPQSDAGRRAHAAARYFVATLPSRISPPGTDATRENRRHLGVGMSIIGSHGTGKTELACAILTEISRRYNVSTCYVRADDYIDSLLRTQGKPPSADAPGYEEFEKADALIRRAVKSRVTVLDDLGKEHKTDSKWAGRKINTFLRLRHERLRPTIPTSNDPIPKWAIYDDALPSFAAQAFPPVLLIGADLRARQ